MSLRKFVPIFKENSNAAHLNFHIHLLNYIGAILFHDCFTVSTETQSFLYLSRNFNIPFFQDFQVFRRKNFQYDFLRRPKS